MNEDLKICSTIDIVKFVMALLVIGIHTEPFGFNVWLDRGFGMVTRLCVPFFFVTSAYFVWSNNKNIWHFIKRILILYIVWSLLYLPFDIKELSTMSIGLLLNRYLWSGNEHALWYLCSSIIGSIITYSLLKIFKPKTVLIISLLFLLLGCLKSTYSPLLEELFNFRVTDYLGSRNGLFYGFPYISLGMYIAKSPTVRNYYSLKKNIIQLLLSLLALAVESFVFVVLFKTSSTILWLSVFPYTYTFFVICLNTKIIISKNIALKLRKISTLMYVSQYMFIPYLSNYFKHIKLYVISSAITAIFGFIVVKISEMPHMKWLKHLY